MLFLVASIMATILFEIVKSAFNKTLNDDFGIESTVGTKSLSLTWIGTAFAVAAGLFWTLSICCCSGRSPYHYKDKEGGGFGGMAMPGRGRGRTKAERVSSRTLEEAWCAFMLTLARHHILTNESDRLTWGRVIAKLCR